MNQPYIIEQLSEIFALTQTIQEGRVASYIPQLAGADPTAYALAACFVDGQQAAWGNSSTQFCLQSVCKPINYWLALEAIGQESVHKHVGFEPSGSVFNALNLNSRGLPHNPLINAGGIMCCSLIRPEASLSERFDLIAQTWEHLTAGARPGFDNAVYQSERQTADRNYALAHFMRENGAFPKNTDLQATLELYFQACSMTLNVQQLAVVAATLANGGHQPLNDEALCKGSTIRNLLTVMSTCGMYNYSGEFAFRIGLPAKSGVSGGLMLVVPGLMGLAIWSPPLDENGNTVRGIAFCQELVKKLPLHVYEQWPAQRNRHLIE